MERACLFRAMLGILAFGPFLAAGGPARAQDLPDATRAVSREITMYIPPEGQKATLVTSREVTFYIPPEGQEATRGISREVTMFIPAGALSTLATSREVTAHFGYKIKDAENALRIAAGLQAGPPGGSWDFGWLNAVVASPSATVIDILDAVAIMRASQ